MSSSFDLPTTYISSLTDILEADAAAMGHEVRHIRDNALTPESYADAVESFKPDIVIGAGHGGTNVFTTMNVSPLIVACTNDGELAGTGVVFLSCLTGVVLAPSIVSKGGKSVAAFTSEFAWIVSAPYDPYSDPYWQPFARMLLESTREVLRGNGWGAWYSVLQRVGREEESKWGQSTDPQAPDIVYAIRHDLACATVVGEGAGAYAGAEGIGILALIPLAVLLMG